MSRPATLPIIALALTLLAFGCSDPEINDPPAPDKGVDLQPRDDAGEPDMTPEPEEDVPDPEPEVMEPDPNPVPEPTMEPDTPPDDPYEALEGLSDQALKAGLGELVSNHRIFTYGESRDFMYGIRARIDVLDGEIECLYTGRKTEPDQTRTPGGFNTEHSWPRNEDADTEPMLSDLHHLFPTTEDSNQARGSKEFGETSCAGGCDFSDGGSEVGSRQGGGGDIFEVRPLRRGDIARAHFYFALRYERRIGANEEATLRQWHAEDPPDDHERARNDAIERFQQNRNPFVDRPDFVDDISDF